MTRFLDWLGRHRGERTLEERSRHLGRFADANGDRNAVAVTGSHLEAFQDALRGEGHAADYVLKHVVSVKAMYRWGSRHRHVPADFSPFVMVEPIRLAAKVLHESDLPTDVEIKALLAFADADLTPVGQGRGARRRRPHEYRTGAANPWIGVGDLIRVYHATGARTHELIEATIGDFQPSARTIVLGKHKRSRTLRVPTPRTITLNAESHEIVHRRCEKRPADAPVFTQPRNGRPWTVHAVNERFRAVRERAGVRDSITPYSFRHLWISEALMAGVDVLLIARMAGTSVKMVESVYGHFRTQSYADAQAKLDAARRPLP